MSNTDSIDSSFNTPSADDVLLEDEEYLPVTVPVTVENVVRVDEMPTTVAFRRIIMPDGADAELLCNADPRRKSITIWMFPFGSGAEVLCLAGNKGDAQAFAGAMMINNFTIHTVKLETKSEVWIRPAIMTDTGGTLQGFAVSTDNVIVSAIIEQWAN